VGRRLLASTVAIALVALTVLGVPLAYLLDRVVEDAARARLQRQVDAIALTVDDRIRTGRLPTVEELDRLTPRGDWVVIRADGARAEGGRRPSGETLAATAEVTPGATVRLETSVRPFDARVRRSILVLLAVGGAGLGGAAVLAVIQARRFARPLENLARAADRLGAGDFSATVPRCGLPEIDAVADALEAGGRRVADMVNAERRFSAHASHQLRSALTGLSLSLEELAVDAEPGAADGVAAALDQVARLSVTVEELLHLARTGRAGERRTFDATRLVGQHVEDWRPRFALRNRVLVLTATAPLPVRAAPGALGQAIDVLLSNALRHGDGAATVTIRRIEGHGVVEVSDEGPGVDPSARGRLFDPAGVNAEGHGIGLSLARLLVVAEGGSLDLVDPDAAMFRIRLAAADDAGEASGAGDS
jgi:signal transduction histidine kinase